MERVLLALKGQRDATAVAWWCFGGSLAAALRAKRTTTQLKRLGKNNPEFRVVRLGDAIIAHDSSTKIELHPCQYTGDRIVVITTIHKELEEFLMRYEGFKAFEGRGRKTAKISRR